MAETAEKLRREATEKEHIPVTPGVTDLPSAIEEGDVERVAGYVRRNLLEVDATVQAIKEHLTMERMKRIASFKVREAVSTPETRKKGIAVLSAVVLALAGFGVILRLKHRRGRKKAPRTTTTADYGSV